MEYNDNNQELTEQKELQNTSLENEELKSGIVDKPTRKSKKQFILGMLAGCAVMLVVLSVTIVIIAYSLGYRIRTVSGDNSNTTAQNTGVSMRDIVLDDATIAKVNAILSTFDKSSILELDEESFRRAIIDGTISGSGDKYAQYYDAEEIAELMGDYGGTFFGIGATLSLNSMGYAEVQSTYIQSPAEIGGLREGDIITAVEGNSVYGMALDEIVALIRGPEGTDVVLTIAREGAKDYMDLTFTRAKIEIIVVEYEMIEAPVGYIHIAEWYDTTSEQFAKAMADLKSQGMEALVIDLRSNTGGLLKSVVAVSQQMLPAGTVVYTEDKNGRKATYECDGESEIDIPVVILTNGYTASASEILTGAMKDYGKAISVGTNTYGKGVVQSFISFSDGTAMKLTTEQYFTPNGTAIDGVGIAPDIEVEFDSDAYYAEENPTDNQLDVAVEYLLNELN